jgi:hypothetical protein
MPISFLYSGSQAGKSIVGSQPRTSAANLLLQKLRSRLDSLGYIFFCRPTKNFSYFINEYSVL